MANATLISCSNLASRTDFGSYVTALRAATGNNFSLVGDCRTEVCNALWGFGNPDISGIGVSLDLGATVEVAADLVERCYWDTSSKIF